MKKVLTMLGILALFLFGIIGLSSNCIVSSTILIILACYALPIKFIQNFKITQLEQSYKKTIEKQPELTFEQFKQSSKIIYLVICIILCTWIFGNWVTKLESAPSEPIANVSLELENRLKSIVRGQNTIFTIEKTYIYKSKSIDDLYFIGTIVKGSFDEKQKDNTYNCILACSDAKCSLFGLAMNTQAMILFNIAPLSTLTKDNQKSLWENVNNINQQMDGYTQMEIKLNEINPAGALE